MQITLKRDEEFVKITITSWFTDCAGEDSETETTFDLNIANAPDFTEDGVSFELTAEDAVLLGKFERSIGA